MSEINDRVPKVKGFKYPPDMQTTFIFLDELADEVHQQRVYIKRLEDKLDFLMMDHEFTLERIRELETK